MISRKKGYTFLELFIVVTILSVMVAAFFSSMSSSKRGFQNSEYAINNQQDARKAVDRVAWELKKSSTSWEVSGNFYNVVINQAGDQIDFYVPVSDIDNQIVQLKAVRYCMDNKNTSQLIRKEGAETTVVTNNVDNVLAQKPFFSFNNPEQTIIDIKIPVKNNNIAFTLTSQVNLRNRNVQLGSEVVIEEIQED